MNKKQSRQFLNMKLQARVNEAKCRAMIDDKLLSSLFDHEIQQLHYETTHKKLEMTYALEQLSLAHNKYLSNALEQYSSTIKSNKSLLRTVNSQINRLMDKERELMELREDTMLGVKEAIDVEFDSILNDESTPSMSETGDEQLCLLPPVPTHEVTEPKKSLLFGNVMIKTIDEVEDEKESKRQDDETQSCAEVSNLDMPVVDFTDTDSSEKKNNEENSVDTLI